MQALGPAGGAQLVWAAGLLEGEPALGCACAQRLTALWAARTAPTCKRQGWEASSFWPMGWLLT